MAKIPVPFRKIRAAFDDEARARLCQSSGSEHSAAAEEEESVTRDLSRLVDSFFETEWGGDDDVDLGECEDKKKNEERSGLAETESYWADLETKEMLMSLIGGCGGGEVEEEEDSGGLIRGKIRAEVEAACRSLGSSSTEGFKRRVMSLLRQKGYDAGLCKSRWEKTAGHPAGEYEYVDIIVSKTRYIVEVSLTNQFTVARPTDRYTALLEIFPHAIVCKEYDLKRAVRLMCAAMRESIKTRDMHVPPWRRNAYMQAKWFGPYRRTTNAVSTKAVTKCHELVGKCFVGFDSRPGADLAHRHLQT